MQVVLAISSDFSAVTLEMGVAARNRKKTHKNPYLWGSRSYKVIDVGTPETLSAVLVMLSSKSVSICNCSHARRANSSKIAIS